MICTSCFSKGREFGAHRSNHKFSIIKNNFSVFSDEGGHGNRACNPNQKDEGEGTEWNASEELQLLNGVLKFGYGNWEDVARSFNQPNSQISSSGAGNDKGGGGIRAKDASECQMHFQKVYVDDATGQFRSVLEGLGPEGTRKDQPITYVPDGAVPQTTGIDSKSKNNAGIYFGSSLIRPGPGTQPSKDLAGYNAARADFDSEFDNQFELHLNGIEANDEMYKLVESVEDDSPTSALAQQVFGSKPPDFIGNEEEDSLAASLSVAALEVYRSKLKARHRRKRVIKEYGLLNKAKAMSLPSRYPHLNATKYESLYKYGSRLIQCSIDFDFILEGLHHEMMLRQQILHLQEYRTNGLTRLAAINVFHGQKGGREQQLRHLSMLTETIQDWEAATNAPNKNIITFYEDKDLPDRLIPTTLGATRRSVAPLDIVGLPAYDKLTQEERDLCTEQRVYPEVFVEIKTLMEQECAKHDGLRLADIRPLVKIDVNKTRKIYDYFLLKELIYKPSDAPNEG